MLPQRDETEATVISPELPRRRKKERHQMIPSEPTAAAGTALKLSQLKPFGMGGRRLCFVHPLDPAKCVKVLRHSACSEARSTRSFIPKRLRRHYDNNAHEFEVLTALFDRLGPVAGRCLPQCYGWTETDLGRGLVLDLIRDYDGKISRSLRQLVSTGTALANFRPAFDELAAFLIQHKVLTRALLNHNIVAQRLTGGGWRLFLIDGLGDPSWLPLGRWIPAVAEARIRRKVTVAWTRFERFAAKHA